MNDFPEGNDPSLCIFAQLCKLITMWIIHLRVAGIHVGRPIQHSPGEMRGEEVVDWREIYEEELPVFGDSHGRWSRMAARPCSVSGLILRKFGNPGAGHLGYHGETSFKGI